MVGEKVIIGVGDIVSIRKSSEYYGTVIYWADKHHVLEINDNLALVSDGQKEDDEKYFPLEDLIVVKAKNSSLQYVCHECRGVFVYPDEKNKNGSNVCDWYSVDVCPFCGHEYFLEK